MLNLVCVKLRQASTRRHCHTSASAGQFGGLHCADLNVWWMSVVLIQHSLSEGNPFSASSVEEIDSIEVRSDVCDEWLGMWKEGS